MAIFGLSTKKEVKAIVDETVKAAMLENAPAWVYSTAEAERLALGDPSVYEQPQNLYRKLSWILQCVDSVANSAALAKFSVARVIANKEPKDIPNHPFEMLLESPNPLDSRYEFLFATVASKKLTGNGYWFINAESESAPPDELWFIPSHMIIPVPDERMFLRGYMYYPGNGREILLEPWEIIHFRRFNPYSRFIGLSAVESIMTVSVGDIKMQEWNTRLFAENNARLPGILTFQQMIQDPTWEKIKADTREAAKKRELLMLRGVGGTGGQSGVNWIQSAVSQKDMEFLEGRDFNKEEIYNTLAPGLFSYLSESATEANSRTGKAAFDELSVYPEHVAINQKVTKDILPKYGSDRARPLVGRFEDVRMEDRELRLREQAEYARTHTVNQINEKYYESDAVFEDERGQLFPAQINAQSGGIQEPPPNPFTDRPDRDKDKQPTPPKQKAIKANGNSMMIALRIPDVLKDELKEMYKFIDRETLDDLHITLVYLGDSRTINKVDVYRAASDFATMQTSIKGRLQGLARFVSGGDKDPLVVTFDSPQMPKVYNNLCGILDAYHIPFHRDYGFIPHMTISYIAKDAGLPIRTVEPMEINFSEIYLVDSEVWTPIELKGFDNPSVKAEPDKSAKAVVSLNTWRRLAIKKVGKVVEYGAADVPWTIADYVNQHLPHCKSVKAVRDVFDEAIRMAKQKDALKQDKPSDALTVLEAIRLAVS